METAVGTQRVTLLPLLGVVKKAARICLRAGIGRQPLIVQLGREVCAFLGGAEVKKRSATQQ